MSCNTVVASAPSKSMYAVRTAFRSQESHLKIFQLCIEVLLVSCRWVCPISSQDFLVFCF